MDNLEEACKRGLRQIEEKGYEQELREEGYRNWQTAEQTIPCTVSGAWDSFLL